MLNDNTDHVNISSKKKYNFDRNLKLIVCIINITFMKHIRNVFFNIYLNLY